MGLEAALPGDEYDLAQLQNLGIFSDLDCYFARFLGQLAQRTDPLLLFSAALVSQWTARSHVCLDLAALAGEWLPLEHPQHSLRCPPLSVWLDSLANLSVVGRPGDYAPLILDSRHRLYLYRYWHYEQRIATRIQALLNAPPPPLALDLLRQQLAQFFPATNQTVDWQAVAAVTALTHRFCVISGGPGTGKTATVVKILALLVAQAGATPLRIALLAPTGKAAMRLRTAISQAKLSLGDTRLRDAIPEDTATLHRALGPLPNSPYFRHHANNPLMVDVVIVDEASMVDVALMAKLLDALPSTARLILLGDKDQLASVEAGAVLGDLCATDSQAAMSATAHAQLLAVLPSAQAAPVASVPLPAMQDALVVLRHSYRFDAHSAIGQLSSAVNQGDATAVLRHLRNSQRSPEDSVAWLEQPSLDDLLQPALTAYARYLQEPDISAALQAFNRFRILCAHRQGPEGVTFLNRQLEERLQRARLLRGGGTWYPGRPVMITENHYGLRLFNGDLGLILPDPTQPQRLYAWFETSDGLRRVLPARLPAHETAYAMTVHKSQGSEFDDLLLVLPQHLSPVLSRELLYTGITRARQRLTLIGSAAVIRQAVQTRTRRASGLRDALWGSAD